MGLRLGRGAANRRRSGLVMVVSGCRSRLGARAARRSSGAICASAMVATAARRTHCKRRLGCQLLKVIKPATGRAHVQGGWVLPADAPGGQMTAKLCCICHRAVAVFSALPPSVAGCGALRAQALRARRQPMPAKWARGTVASGITVTQKHVVGRRGAPPEPPLCGAVTTAALPAQCQPSQRIWCGTSVTTGSAVNEKASLANRRRIRCQAGARAEDAARSVSCLRHTHLTARAPQKGCQPGERRTNQRQQPGL